MIKSKKPPYENTKIDPDSSRVDIDKLLRSYGIQKIIWASDYEHNDVRLAFEIEAEIQGIRKGFTVTLRPPLILKQIRLYNPKKGITEKVKVPNWSQSMRMMYWYLKSKVEAIAYGLVSVEKEFLSQVMVSLPIGSSTVGEILEPIMTYDRLDSLPYLAEKTVITKDENKVIEIKGEIIE